MIVVHFLVVVRDDVGQRARGKGEGDHADELEKDAKKTLVYVGHLDVAIADGCKGLHGEVGGSCVQVRHVLVLEVVCLDPGHLTSFVFAKVTSDKNEETTEKVHEEKENQNEKQQPIKGMSLPDGLSHIFF